jgi:hypothetical protein
MPTAMPANANSYASQCQQLCQPMPTAMPANANSYANNSPMSIDDNRHQLTTNANNSPISIDSQRFQRTAQKQ